MAMTSSAQLPPYSPERRMLIDGELVESSGGGEFDNINPATEEVLGLVAAGTPDDMGRAIGAARRAFDETDWSVNRELRARCLLQLQEAIEAEVEEFRSELVAEVGTPVAVTYMAQLDWPLADAFRWPAKMISEFEWERRLPDSTLIGFPSHRAVRRGAGGGVGGVVPWDFPFEVTANKLGRVLG